MSSVSAPSFEAINPSENFEPTISFSCDPSPQHMETQVRKPLQERVQEIKISEKLSTYVIDGCFQLHDYSKSFYKESVKKLRTIFAVCIALSTASSIKLFIMSPSLVITPSLGQIALAATCTALFISSIFYAAWLYRHTSDILWNGLLPFSDQVASLRESAYTFGFPVVFYNQLKFSDPTSLDGIIHPAEAKFLYDEYLKSWCKESLSKQPSADESKAQWMHNFFICNPLSAAVMQYGLSSIPDAWKGITEEYDLLVKSLKQPTYESLKARFESKTAGSKEGLSSSDAPDEVKEFLTQAKKLQISVLQEIQDLKSKYRSELNEKGVDLNSLAESFEYEMLQLQKQHTSQLLQLKQSFQEKIKLLDNPSRPEHPAFEQEFEQIFIEALKIFPIEQDENLIQLYPTARALLEKASKLIVF